MPVGLDIFFTYYRVVAKDPRRPIVIRATEGEDILADLALDCTSKFDDTPYLKGHAVAF